MWKFSSLIFSIIAVSQHFGFHFTALRLNVLQSINYLISRLGNNTKRGISLWAREENKAMPYCCVMS